MLFVTKEKQDDIKISIFNRI
uniref:Uncharacterized protein n=1 Tax=Arundo donax TaxID=35708 RepID=A0A0A8ZNF9_ARUDO